MNEERLPQKNLNGVHLEEEEEKEGLEIRGCLGELTTCDVEWIDMEEWRREIKI